MEYIKKIMTLRGEARSITSLPPSYDVRVNGARQQNQTSVGADWFGPLSPMRPIAPPEVAGRALDYVPGYNLATQPRTYEPVSFPVLRALADSFDPVRLIIERRKDQLCRVPWAIRMKHEGASNRPSASALSSQQRALIREATEFFKHPTPDLSFRAWMRAVLEDALVIDAPSIYCERDGNGNLIALTPIDGSLIKRVIDDKGRTPRPFRWDGKPFTSLGQTITTENYADLGYKIVDGFVYAPAYQQILKNMPAANLTCWDLLYRPMNLRPGHVYGCSPVQQIMTTVSIAMRRSLSQLEYFREGNQPDAIMGLPETWSPDQVMRFQDYFDALYSGNLANRRRMKFIAGDGKYTPTKEPPLKNEFDEWLTRIACFAFSYPPAAFISLSNRSIAEQHEKTAEEEGLGPLKEWTAELINDVIEREFSEEIEFAWLEEQEVDQEKQSTILRGYAEDGIMTLNEARDRLGLEPFDDPAANRLMVKTKNGYVPISGGDDAEDDDVATKLAKRAPFLMVAPDDWIPCNEFKLGEITFFPDVSKREIRVFGAAAIIVLERAGWKLKESKQ